METHEHCHDFLESLSEYVSGDLDDALCAELDRHMAECKNCRIVVDTLRKTVNLYHVTSEAPALPEEVRERLFRSLNLEEFLQK